MNEATIAALCPILGDQPKPESAASAPGPICDNGSMTSNSIEELTASVRGLTAPKQFLDLVREHGDQTALRTMDAPGAAWRELTYAELAERVGQAAAGLRAAGVQPGDRVLLMMRNRPEFHWLDIAAQFLRATSVSIYNSSSAEEIAYLAGHAEARLAIVEGGPFLQRVLRAAPNVRVLDAVYVVGDPGEVTTGDVALHPLDDLLAHGSLDLDELAADTSPDDVATMIYTSGTTGPPKAVMISQFNVVYTVESLRRTMGYEEYGKRTISYLPMAHIAERMVGLYIPMRIGFNVATCADIGRLSEYLGAVRPQLMFGVPRVWEKIYNAVMAALAADPDKLTKFNEAVDAALVIKQAERDGTVTKEQTDTWEFLDAVAFSQVRQLVGLDQLELAISGAAPIQRRVLEWYAAIGVPFNEIYGLSETSGPMTWSPFANRPGWVGQAIPGVEVRLADDGEICCRGGVVFAGYYQQPDKTAEAIVDGWFHSGDIGEFSDDGYLRIVDRKKELIITSGGKNVSPANLETALRGIPLVGQAAVIGDNRKYLTALLVLDPEAAKLWAGQHGVAIRDMGDDQRVIDEVQAGVDEVNEQFAQVEQIKKFTVLTEEWQPDSELLTPTSKLKRRGVNTVFAEQIEAMYHGA